MKKLLCSVTIVCLASCAATETQIAETKESLKAPTKLVKGDFTLESFIAMHKTKTEKSGKKFFEKQKVTLFNAMDANSDGILSKKERNQYWSSKKKK